MTYGKALGFLMLVAIFAFSGSFLALRMSGMAGFSFFGASSRSVPVYPTLESTDLRVIRVRSSSPVYSASGNAFNGAPVPPLGGDLS